MVKNKPLSYTAPEPAFLRALRAGHTLASQSPDPLQQARPKKNLLRGNQDEDDDAPVYVDAESGDVVEKEVYEGMKDGNGVASGEKEESEVGAKIEAQRLPEKVVDAMRMAKKRKAVKVVGGEDDEDEKASDAEVRVSSSKIAETKADDADTSTKPKAKSKGTKKKKIKLSFEED